MSLINEALKLEQKKRSQATAAYETMGMRPSAAVYRRGESKLTAILAAFAGMGLLIAVSLGAVLHFGAQNTAESAAKGPEAGPTTASRSHTQENAVEAKQAASPENSSSPELDAAQSKEIGAAPAAAEIIAAAAKSAPSHAELARIQAIVDSFTVQGIRKAGQDSRVFMDGKIRRIGETVEIEHGLVLLGFTDTSLVFRSRSGHAFQKSL